MKHIVAYLVSIIFCDIVIHSSAFLNSANKLHGTNLISQLNSNSPKPIRGNRYNDATSSIPAPNLVAARLNVKPTKEASPKTWKMAWNTHKRLLPLLHSTDSCKPADSSLNLACMWWKALSGQDKTSPVYDKGLSYDLLPSGWRKIIILRRFYPRLHHGNVELRTAYLDNAIVDAISNIKKSGQRKIRLICMGAGYDARGVKMLERGIVNEVVELDLPEVVTAKKRLLDRLLKRRPWLTKYHIMPKLIPSDFNDVNDVQNNLSDVVNGNDDERKQWHNIFVFEGVMIYLEKGVPSKLLNMTSNVLVNNGCEEGSLCFADRLENIPGGDYDLGKQELERNGWHVKDWCPKPGLARHMGWCELF